MTYIDMLISELQLFTRLNEWSALTAMATAAARTMIDFFKNIPLIWLSWAEGYTVPPETRLGEWAS